MDKEVALENFRRYFGFDASEKVKHVCTCSWKQTARSSGFFGGKKNTIHEGLLYGSTNHISFVDPDHRKLKKTIPLELITAIRPGMDSNSIQIETAEIKYYFVSFKKRDEAMGKFMEIWAQDQQGSEEQNILTDPLSVGATIGVLGQKIKVTGKDIAAAASVARKHADKVSVSKQSDGSFNVNYDFNKGNSTRKKGSSSANDAWQYVKVNKGSGRRYIRMGGHKGLQASRMGTYIEQPELSKDGYSAYKHIEGDWYLYYYKPNRFWFVGSRIGKRSGWLYVQSEERYPDRVNKNWRYWDDGEKKWLTDSNIVCQHIMAAEARTSKASREPRRESHMRSERKGRSRVPLDDSNVHVDDVQIPQESVFTGSKLEDTWFSALYSLYSHADSSTDPLS